MTHRHLPPKYQLRLRRVLGATYATVAAFNALSANGVIFT